VPPENYKGFPDPSRVVSFEEASVLLREGRAVFVDTRNYWDYVEGHIPGAVNLELYAFHWYDTTREGLETFGREMANLLGAYGIDETTQVVFYENNSGYAAARGVWLLEFLGNKNGRLLDGGLGLWGARGGELSSVDPQVRRVRFTPNFNPEVVCSLDELSEGVQKRTLQVLDSRSPGEYSGIYRRALKGGHVPGAINVEWTQALREDGSWKDAAELAPLYSGLSPDARVAVYCQSGYRAAHSWLVLKLLGFTAPSNYLGSWYEWGNHPTTRVET